MNVNLTPELEKMVRDKVESGLYHSASEVIRDALRLMLDVESRPSPKFVTDSDSAQYRTSHGSGLSGRPRRPFGEVLDEIHAGQRARGHVPPTREEVDRFIEELRSGGDR